MIITDIVSSVATAKYKHYICFPYILLVVHGNTQYAIVFYAPVYQLCASIVIH